MTGLVLVVVAMLCAVGNAIYQFDYRNENYLNGKIVQYEYNSVKKNWIDANAYCQTNGGYGAFLASFETKNEAVTVSRAILAAGFSDAGRKNGKWIGIYRVPVIEPNCDYLNNKTFLSPWQNIDGTAFIDLDIAYNASVDGPCYTPLFPNDLDGDTKTQLELCTWQFHQPSNHDPLLPGRCTGEYCVQMGNPEQGFYTGD